MKAILLGATRSTGISYKKSSTGVPYDIINLQITTPVESRSWKDGHMTGHGFTIAELPATEDAFNRCAGMKFPAEVEMQTDNRIFGGRLTPICVGFEKCAPKPAQ